MASPTAHPRIVTSGDIARALGAKVTRVRHILATREHIRPVGRAGMTRLYTEAAINDVAAVLDEAEEHLQTVRRSS